MTDSRAIRALQALRKDILADGEVDWEETERLIVFMRPRVNEFGDDFRRYVELLDRCREDGKITHEESEQLATSLELMCLRFTCQRLRFWLVVSIVALVIVAIFV